MGFNDEIQSLKRKGKKMLRPRWWAAINMLADGFVKTEQKKMEMAREIEVMRMDMETKRLKMILESQERLMEAFTMAASDKKKPK